MGAILKITFLTAAEVDDTLQFKYYGLFPDTTEFVRGFTFKTLRSFPGQCTIGSDAIDQAIKYTEAFTADYLSADFMVEREINIVTITCLNGSDIFDASLNEGADFATFEDIITSSNNIIHIINMTPSIYAVPAITARNYLITEDDYLLLTENNKKIRL